MTMPIIDPYTPYTRWPTYPQWTHWPATPERVDVKVVPPEVEGELISVSSWRQPSTIAAVVTAIATTVLAIAYLMKGR